MKIREDATLEPTNAPRIEPPTEGSQNWESTPINPNCMVQSPARTCDERSKSENQGQGTIARVRNLDQHEK